MTETLTSPAGASPGSLVPQPAPFAVAAALPPPAQRPPLITTSAEAIAIAHDFAASIKDGAAARDRERVLPIAEIERYSATGLWGISVPRAYGGPELPIATLSEIIRIVSAADPSIGQIPQNHWAFLNLLRAERDEARKAYFFGKVLDGYRFGNALVEMGTKTAADWKTTFTQDGDDFIIHGTKFYCTGALFSHFIPTVGRTESGAVLRAIVPRTTPGVTIIDDWSGFGQRTTASGTVQFDQVRVPASHIIGLGGLREQPLIYGAISQIFQAAIDAGIAHGAFADTLDFVRHRARPWIDSGKDRAAEDPLTIAAIGDTRIKLRAADLVLAYAGQVIDEELKQESADGIARASLAVAEAKVLTTEVALHAASQLFELAGTSSTLAKDNFDRHWRNARVHTLHDPVRWKYYALGDYELNGTVPPIHSWI